METRLRFNLHRCQTDQVLFEISLVEALDHPLISEAGEGAGGGFVFPALFGSGDIFEERAEVIVYDSWVEEAGRSCLWAFAGGDFAEFEISERSDR